MDEAQADNASVRLRSRAQQPQSNTNSTNDSVAQDEQERPRGEFSSIQPKAAFTLVILGTVYLVMGIFVHHRMNSYPVPKTIADSEPSDFIEENARRHLDKLSALGPKVAGSEANMKAEQYILNEIHAIKRESISSNIIDIDVQETSGGFTLNYALIGQFTSVYQDLRNIIIKISPPHNATHSVLLNCHYDTVADSPGAGDDIASCCVMLEILRSLTQSKVNLMHNLVFLFNGAEENILQTSHGFITQHHWAHPIKTFINLDSAGAGGWEIVFQTGPEHPWLIRAYIESAPHPHASVLGQEIFQTGLIPSDTDYRIFRDYGRIPGLDIAHIKNGYVYHTKNDKPSFIPPGCLQRGGENVKGLLLTLAKSSKVIDPGEDKHGTMVFFDFIGFFMVAYPHRMAIILNWSTLVYVYIAILKRLRREWAAGDRGCLIRLLTMTLCLIATWVICILVPVGMAFLMTLANRNMTYFSQNLNVVWLFILPSITAAMQFHSILRKSVFKHVSPEKVVILIQDANLLIWSFLLALMTYYGLMSSFIPLMCVLWPSFFYIILDLFGLKPTGLVFNLIASFAPSLYAISLSYTLLLFIIPIMGRIGLERNPDVLIAVISSFPVLVCLPYQIGFVYTHRQVKRVVSTTAAVILLGIFAILFTNAGFPYSSKPSDASAQRALLVHFDRNFHSFNKDIIKSDSGIWYKPLDPNGGGMLEQHAPEVMSMATKATCDGAYCGRPYLYPFLSQINPKKTYDFPASPLKIPRVDVKLVEEKTPKPGHKSLTFEVIGPSHISMYIMELPGGVVNNWSFGHNIPVEIFTLPTIHNPTFFIYYSHGRPNSTWEFTLDLSVFSSSEEKSPVIKMGLAGHYLHGPNKQTKDLQSLNRLLPNWLTTTTWSATYDEYYF